MPRRKEYTASSARLPVLTERFRKIVDDNGGITKVSELTNISRPTISYWYYGARTPDAESLIKLHDTLAVSSDYLLGLDDCPHIDNKVRAVHNVTGLSVDAIFKLNAISNGRDKNTFPRIISSLIENENSEFFLRLLSSLIAINGSANPEQTAVNIHGEPLFLPTESFLKEHIKTLFIEQLPNIIAKYHEMEC